MKVSPEEVKNGALSETNLGLALRTLSEAGSVTLEDVLPLDWVAMMRDTVASDMEIFLQDEERRKMWFGDAKRHVGMMAPVRLPYMDPLVIENPFALQVMEAAMGSDIYSTFYNTNNALPGSGVQHIHRDANHLFPTEPFYLPVTQVVLNIPLVDFTVENGATEIWPGSHRIIDTDPLPASGRAPLEERAALLPSERTIIKAGSLAIRDLRMWHRGVPNQSDSIRSMLAIVYSRGMINRGDGLKIPRALWEGMSERTQKLFRYNRVVDDEPTALAA